MLFNGSFCHTMRQKSFNSAPMQLDRFQNIKYSRLSSSTYSGLSSYSNQSWVPSGYLLQLPVQGIRVSLHVTYFLLQAAPFYSFWDLCMPLWNLNGFNQVQITLDKFTESVNILDIMNAEIPELGTIILNYQSIRISDVLAYTLQCKHNSSILGK